MTVEQYEKGREIYAQINGLRGFIGSLESEKSIIIQYPDRIENEELYANRFLYDNRVRNNVSSYIHFNEIAIKAELIDFAKDEIAKLEDQLKTI